MQFKQKPLTLVCYICGREFGTKSLEIHLKSCKEKFVNEQNKKEKHERIKLPQEPEMLRELLKGNLENIREYNEQAGQIHKYKMLPACRYCGRTFNEDSLKIHEKVCPNKSNSFGKNIKEENFKEEIIKKPRTLVCCTCGREFGLTSLKIHYPQCIQKFKNDQKKKPKEQRKQIPKFTPEDLELIMNKQDWTIEEIQEFNKKASAHFKDKGMVYCQNCKRTFMPEPFKRHLKNCELINGKNIKEEDEQKFSSSNSKMISIEEIKKPKVLMCHICGRQFGLTSLQIHQKACKTKFINNQKQKPVGQRKPLPEIPEVVSKFNFESVQSWNVQTIEEYNKIAGEAYRNQSMYECPLCHRKFIEQSYYKHKRYCEKQHQKIEENKKIDKSPSPMKINNSSPQKNYQSPVKMTQNHETIKEMPEQLQHTKKEQLQQKQQNIPFSDNITFRAKQNQPLIPLTQNVSLVQDGEAPSDKIIDGVSDNIQSKPSSQKSIVEDVLQVSSFSDKDQSSPSKQTIKGEKQKKTIKEKPNNDKNNQIPSYNQQLPQQNIQLGQCQKCGRKFVIERLEKHQNICKGTKKQFVTSKNPLKKETLNELKNQKIHPSRGHNISPHIQAKIEDKEEEFAPQGHSKMLVPCKNCGRRFLDTRVEKHQQNCKGKKLVQSKQEQEKQDAKIKSDLNYQRFTPHKKDEVQEKQNKGDRQPLYNVMAGYNQFEEIPSSELKPCSKCGRKFKVDRVQIHENVCKGPSAHKSSFNKELKEAEKARNTEIVRKTKESFFKMVKEIKNQKMSEEQIDRDLSAELRKLEKEPQSGRVLHKRKFDVSSKEKPEKIVGLVSKNNMQKLDVPDGLESVSKWKKPGVINTPKLSIVKGGKHSNRLPEL